MRLKAFSVKGTSGLRLYTTPHKVTGIRNVDATQAFKATNNQPQATVEQTFPYLKV